MEDDPTKEVDSKVFVGGLCKNTNASSLKDYFSGYGEVADSIVMTNKNTGESKGFGFVTFKDSRDAKNCLEQPTHLIDNVQVEVKKAVPKDKLRDKVKEPQPPVDPDTTKVFIGGLSEVATKEDVEKALASYGIVSAKIMTQQGTEKPRGFAFAYFDSAKSAQAVAKIKWFQILDRNVECKLAVPKDSMEGKTSNARIPRSSMVQPQYQDHHMGGYHDYSRLSSHYGRYGGQQPYGYNAYGAGSGSYPSGDYGSPGAYSYWPPSGYSPDMYSGSRNYMTGPPAGMMMGRGYSQTPTAYGPSRGSNADKDRAYGRSHAHPYSKR